jgi:succinyl-CoA synthetase alpha subunit
MHLHSTVVCVSGDPVSAVGLVECVMADEKTDGAILIGEIGGAEEQEVADLVRERKSPIIVLVVGWRSPQQQRMGNGGILTMLNRGGAARKIAALEKAGGMVAAYADEVVGAMPQVLH